MSRSPTQRLYNCSLYTEHTAIHESSFNGTAETVQTARDAGEHQLIFYTFWNCPKLFWYWHAVVNIINMTFKTALAQDPINRYIRGFGWKFKSLFLNVHSYYRGWTHKFNKFLDLRLSFPGLALLSLVKQ